MTDVHSKETRSYNMSRIRSKDTKPEMLVRKFLHAHGFRYRIHMKDLPGKPDLVLPKYRTVIFVHGCFWHGHETCNSYLKPKSNIEFWQNKFQTNMSRDKKNVALLKSAGWKVLTIWECELKSQHRQLTLETLIKEIHTR